MADFRAVAAVSEAILQLLRSNYREEDFNQELQFRVFTAQDFSDPPSAGVSLFVYRLIPCTTARTPPGPLTLDGRRSDTVLPLDIHFMLTVWGGQASLQHAIAGWMMRLLEDHPSFAAGLLNTVISGSFRPSEVVEVTLAELSNEDLLRMWETLVQNIYQLSIPYIARGVRIETITRRQEGGGMVEERRLDMGVLESAEGGAP